MLNTQENSDGYLAYKSVIKQKLRPRTKELKMSLTIEEFFEYCFKRNKFLNQENISQTSLYKLIYFYLIESLDVYWVWIYLEYVYNAHVVDSG